MNKNNIIKDIICMYNIKNNVDVINYDDLTNYFDINFKMFVDEHFNKNDELMFIYDGMFVYIVNIYGDGYYDCFRKNLY